MSDWNAGGAPSDVEQADFGFGKGGVPWPLMMLYLGFLVFFVWYVLEYQLPDFLAQTPVASEAPELIVPE